MSYFQNIADLGEYHPVNVQDDPPYGGHNYLMAPLGWTLEGWQNWLISMWP